MACLTTGNLGGAVVHRLFFRPAHPRCGICSANGVRRTRHIGITFGASSAGTTASAKAGPKRRKAGFHHRAGWGWPVSRLHASFPPSLQALIIPIAVERRVFIDHIASYDFHSSSGHAAAQCCDHPGYTAPAKLHAVLVHIDDARGVCGSGWRSGPAEGRGCTV